MLNILAEALLVATRFEAPNSHGRSHPEAPLTYPATAQKRSWAQIVGFKR